MRYLSIDMETKWKGITKLSVAAFFLFLQPSDRRVAAEDLSIFDSHEGWTLHGCDDITATDHRLVYNWINTALRVEVRDIYLAIESSWMDDILSANSKVNVRCVRYDGLADHKPPQPAYDSKNKGEEAYNIIISQVPAATSFTPYTSGAIDAFLLRNPCWTLLHEPVYRAAPMNRNDAISYEHAAVFLQLPMFPYQATCKFFDAITRRQFPKECPPAKDLFFYQATSFGFGGEANKLVKTFHFNLFKSSTRVYASSIAAQETGKWVWLNDTVCPHSIASTNPWTCNFLPFSNCSVGDRKDQTGNWEFDHYNAGRLDGPPHETLKALNITGETLRFYGEGRAYEKQLKKVDDPGKRSMSEW
jgi:hypothetical protein